MEEVVDADDAGIGLEAPIRLRRVAVREVLDPIADVDRQVRLEEDGESCPALEDEREGGKALGNAKAGRAHARCQLEIRHDAPEADRVQPQRRFHAAGVGLLRREIVLEPGLEPRLQGDTVPALAERRERQVRHTRHEVQVRDAGEVVVDVGLRAPAHLQGPDPRAFRERGFGVERDADAGPTQGSEREHGDQHRPRHGLLDDRNRALLHPHFVPPFDHSTSSRTHALDPPDTSENVAQSTKCCTLTSGGDEPRTGGSMDLGIFDHLDHRDVPLHEFYESRLRLLERYDEAGFAAYHLAEHHATPLGLAPVPGIFLAAATQRTRRIRLGPCVYCVPLYDPLRLIEEVCMLDHLSHGRFDFGVGRGIVPYEMAYFNLHHLETEEIYREALEVILQGLTSDVLEHHGPRYTYRKVPMILRPLQHPHPPLWYGMGHAAGADWAATNRVNVITNSPSEMSRPLFERYREVWQRKHGGLPTTKLGMSRHVVVARSDDEAVALARPNYAVWYANLTKLWRDFGAIPFRFARDWDEARQRGVAIAGTAARVREEIERQVAASGCSYFVCRLMFGHMTEAEATSSIDLFTADVMPHLAKLSPAGI